MNRANLSRLAIHLFASAIVAVALTSSSSADWKEKVLYSFQGLPNDGAYPAGGVVFDKAGNLYGATSWGGADNCPGIAQCGIVYQLKPPTEKGKPWSETLLYVFKGVNSNDGNTPEGGVLLDQAGNLYGTTAYGGTGRCRLFQERVGCGTVFELTPPQQHGGKWTERVLHSFQSGKDGYFPWGDLTFDSAGNLYGATQYGGGYGSCNAPYYQYCGTVFKLSPPTVKGGKWTETVLYAFKSGADGANPNGGLVVDAKRAIFGTTYSGGNQNCKLDGSVGCGTAFRLSPPAKKGSVWIEDVLHVFLDYSDGALPSAGLTLDATGSLYGDTLGTVFQLLPSQGDERWKKVTLYSFTNEAWGPEGPLVFDTSGNIYGTTYSSNKFSGTVFRLSMLDQKASSWSFGLLYGFGGGADGGKPAAGLVFNRLNTLYSTTQIGGTGTGCSSYGCGTVFNVSPRAGGPPIPSATLNHSYKWVPHPSAFFAEGGTPCRTATPGFSTSAQISNLEPRPPRRAAFSLICGNHFR